MRVCLIDCFCVGVFVRCCACLIVVLGRLCLCVFDCLIVCVMTRIFV